MRRDRGCLQVGVGRVFEVPSRGGVGGCRKSQFQRDLAGRPQRGHDLGHVHTVAEVGVGGLVRPFGVEAFELGRIEAGGGGTGATGLPWSSRCKPRSRSKR